MEKLPRRKRFQITLSDKSSEILKKMKMKKGLSISVLIDIAVQDFYKNEVGNDERQEEIR